ncbi:MAG: ATP-binding protein [Bacteroidota bacterium]
MHRPDGHTRDTHLIQHFAYRENVHSSISNCFKNELRLDEALNRVLEWLIRNGPYKCGEIWVANEETTTLHMILSRTLDKTSDQFYNETRDVTLFKKGEGIPGHVWETGTTAIWNEIDKDSRFVRHQAAGRTGMSAAFGIPLVHNEEVMGVLLLLADQPLHKDSVETGSLFDVGHILGPEIRRKQQEEQMFLLFESSPDIMGIASPNGSFRRVNPAFTSLLGYTEEEICSRPFSEFIYPEDRDGTLAEFDDTKTGSRQSHNFVNRYVSKNGDVHYISWSSSDVFGLDGYFFAYGRDITAQIRYEESLLELNRKLKLSNEELEQFAYIASHDLQEPLRMISSFMALLHRKYADKLDDTAKEYIHFAVDGAKRMKSILLDLLELSRIGQREEVLEDVSLNDLMAHIEQVFQKEITEKNATITYNALPVVRTSRSPMLQVVQNLVGNALKYSREEVQPTVRVEFDSNDTTWTLRVIDNGIGIESEYHDKIFVLFQRLHQREEYSGTGIGLAIVKKITDRLNGTITVESNPNEGSTFSITFPNEPELRSDYPKQLNIKTP